MPPLLEPGEREPQLVDHVANDVVGPLIRTVDQDGAPVHLGHQAGGGQPRGEGIGAVLNFDTQGPGALDEGRDRGRLEELAGVDRQQEGADPLDLAEQVAGHHGRDPELRPGPMHQVEHLVASSRIEPVRGLVEEQQLGVVDDRLRQLDPLLHAGRVAADRPIALLVQAHVAEHLGGPLARGSGRQPGHTAHVAHELRGGDIGREAVVLRQVAHELPDLRSAGGHVHLHHRRAAARRGEEAEQDLEQRALAGAVGAHKADDPRLHVERQGIQRRDRRAVALGQAPGRDERHRVESSRAGRSTCAAGSRG